LTNIILRLYFYNYNLIQIDMKIEITLWELMRVNKMTGTKLSSLTWISPIQISNIRNWKTTKIGLETIAKLLTAFECEPNDLFKIIKE